MKYNYSICACARWENSYIVEWITYYREIGFEHIYLYCNDDDPGALYEILLPFLQGTEPFVTFYHHPHQGQQFEMYRHFLQNGLKETSWVSFFDIDEYLRLPVGENIENFMARFDPKVESVLFNWIFFGPNGHKTPPMGSVLENFTARETELHPFTKFITRSDVLNHVNSLTASQAHGFWHSVHNRLPFPIKTVNVIGEDMTHYYDDFPNYAHSLIRDKERAKKILELSIIHHYAFRSEQAYFDRVARGLKGDFSGQVIWRNAAQSKNFPDLLARMNAIEDRSLAKFWATCRERALQCATVFTKRPALISNGKDCLQSSISEWSLKACPSEDASGAVNGRLDGSRKFHTALEDNPWWQVDIGELATITEIHVYNTNDHTKNRLTDFLLSSSIDGNVWTKLSEWHGETGLSEPFIWTSSGNIQGRFVRLTLLGRNFLHLNQVEVFGTLGPVRA